MGAVRLKTLADLRRRRLQSIGLALVLFLSTATGTLAMSILVESHAPFDHAFEAANGAHLVIHYARRCRCRLARGDRQRRGRDRERRTVARRRWHARAAEGRAGHRRPVLGPAPAGRVHRPGDHAGRALVAGAWRGCPRRVDRPPARQAGRGHDHRPSVPVRVEGPGGSARGPAHDRRHRRIGEHARRRRLDEPDRPGDPRPERVTGPGDALPGDPVVDGRGPDGGHRGHHGRRAGRRGRRQHDLPRPQGRRRPARRPLRPGPAGVLRLRAARRGLPHRQHRVRGDPDELSGHRRDEGGRVHAAPGQPRPGRAGARAGRRRLRHRRRHRDHRQPARGP